MTIPVSSSPVPAPASATAPAAAGDAASADGSAADGSFSSVFDAATKSPDKAAAESSGADQSKGTADDKSGKHSDEADASTATAAAAIAGLPMMPQAVAVTHAVSAPRDAAAGDSAASVAVIMNGRQSAAPGKTITAADAAADPGAVTDPDATSATAAPGATATARLASSAGGPSKGTSMPQAANLPDPDTAHHADDFKDLTAALAKTTLQPGANALPPPGAASTAAGLHGAAQALQPNAPAAIQHITAPVGSTPWHDEVAHSLLQVITLHQQHAELHVNPPHMGPIDVHVHVAADQAAVTFTAAHADTRAALEQAMPRLRNMLSGQGIFLGQAAVQSDSQPRQGPAQDHRAPRRTTARGAVTLSSPIRVVHYFAPSDRIVDTFA
jgi:flagellar hook-length control protein FliK